jgi:hypothetical protein
LGQNYWNLFDPVTGIVRGKTADGHWREPVLADLKYLEDFTESNRCLVKVPGLLPSRAAAPATKIPNSSSIRLEMIPVW